MNSLFEKYKWLKYVIGALIIALGVLIIVLACLTLQKLQDIINIVVAVSLIIIGLVLLIVCLLFESKASSPAGSTNNHFGRLKAREISAIWASDMPSGTKPMARASR